MTVGIVNLAAFRRGLAEDKGAVRELARDVSRKVGLDVLTALVFASPVDTGRFRGNWQMDIGRDPQGELERTDRAGGATVSANLAALSNPDPFAPVYVVNNLPYGPRLNDGWSRQAPAGFVEAAVDRVVRPFA